jgi:predicted 3-demethylubiquinone-9 3-methyltransferase (glyoxalase superfamily)
LYPVDCTTGGGFPRAGTRTREQCGWLKDKYGVSWQIVPRVLLDLIDDPDPDKAQRATAAMLRMKRIDIAEIRRAHAG